MNSTSISVTRGLLLASGLLAKGVAATILAAPDPFYVSYGIDINSNVSVGNELKAPAGILLAAVCLVGSVCLHMNARRTRNACGQEEAT